jgi:transposase
MRRGQPWREAAREAELTISRATAYRLLRRRRMEGETALHDRRQGHPYVLRPPVRHWLQVYCRAHPTHSGRLIQAALLEQRGLTVSVSQINRVRSTLGLSRRMHRAERTPI